MTALMSNSEEETIQLGARLAEHVQTNDVIVLSGDLGAGKTQFAKGFAAGLGVSDDITSPTFNILLEYVGAELPLLHFDLYRLDEPEELDDIDYFGLLESGGVSLVEWGDKFPEHMPSDYLLIQIRVVDDARRFEIQGFGQRGTQLAEALLPN